MNSNCDSTRTGKLIAIAAIATMAMLQGCRGTQYGEEAMGQESQSHISHEERIRSLEARYRGRSDASAYGQAGLDSSAATAELMAEWNPVGSTRDELKRVMGEPSKEDAHVLEYVFASGRAGSRWRFYLRGDLVTGMDRQSIN